MIAKLGSEINLCNLCYKERKLMYPRLRTHYLPLTVVNNIGKVSVEKQMHYNLSPKVIQREIAF